MYNQAGVWLQEYNSLEFTLTLLSLALHIAAFNTNIFRGISESVEILFVGRCSYDSIYIIVCSFVSSIAQT